MGVYLMNEEGNGAIKYSNYVKLIELDISIIKGKSSSFESKTANLIAINKGNGVLGSTLNKIVLTNLEKVDYEHLLGKLHPLDFIKYAGFGLAGLLILIIIVYCIMKGIRSS